jgi:hypothetical protein
VAVEEHARSVDSLRPIGNRVGLGAGGTLNDETDETEKPVRSLIHGEILKRCSSVHGSGKNDASSTGSGLPASVIITPSLRPSEAGGFRQSILAPRCPVPFRPRKKRKRQAKYHRCKRCGASVRRNIARCKKCSEAQK